MHSNRIVSREGASTPYYWSATEQVPGLVVVPVTVFGGEITLEHAQQIYQLALDKARASCRPSIWSLAQLVCLN
jgi:hypothetical protein